MAHVLDGLPIAVDAMGGDRAPSEVVAGALQAAQDLGIPVLLVGDGAYLESLGPQPGVRDPGYHPGNRDGRGPGQSDPRKARLFAGALR